MDPIAERIREIIYYTGLSNKDFAESISVAPAIISHILSGRNKPSLHIVQQITNVYTNVNFAYLLNGEGDLYSKNVKDSVFSPKDDNLKGRASAPAADPAPIPEPEPDKEEVKQEANQTKEQDGNQLTNVYTNVNRDKGRTIERVILFYSDKTMEEYKP
jgi:transcriptional regulator with XRE-family HTH domain